MPNNYGFDIYEGDTFPLAYLLTLRTYGTWLHGDERHSVRRNGNNRFRGPRVVPSAPLKDAMKDAQRYPSFLLDAEQRISVEGAIREVCDLKAYGTRKLRREWEIAAEEKVWARGGSTRYLWKPRHDEAAEHYVKYCQEDIPFEVSGLVGAPLDSPLPRLWIAVRKC